MIMLFRLFLILWIVCDRLDTWADAINSAFKCCSYRKYHDR